LKIKSGPPQLLNYRIGSRSIWIWDPCIRIWNCFKIHTHNSRNDI